MKKIKLSLNSMQVDAVSREQLKKVLGGLGSGDGSGVAPNATCKAQCQGFSVTCYSYSNTSGCSATDGVGCAGWDSNGRQYWLSC